MQNGGSNNIFALMNQEPFGLLGVSNYSNNFITGDFDYYIACSSDKPTPDGMEEFIVSEATWAIFTCSDTKADAIQKLENSIVMEWLPTSGYEFAKAPDIELYDENGKAEIWLPVKKI
jgi:AraC family transcriptional regulator